MKEARKKRVRKKIKGTAKRPRLSVFRSNQKIYAQLIDDEKGETLAAVGEAVLGAKKKTEGARSKTEKARLIGQALGKRALKKGIKKAIFDRGSFAYFGRVKALAEGAREGGLKF